MGRDVLDLPPPPGGTRIHYGPGEHHYGDLRMPSSPGPHPVAVSIHGGFWRAAFGLDHMSHACAKLALAGVATWNFEYRRVGQPGGGWPGTLDDAASGFEYVKALAESHPLDLKRVVIFGFSAGGHLALWLASHPRRIPLKGVVSLAGVADLRHASEMQLGNGAVDDFLGGSPKQVPDRYRSASPIELLPGGVRTVLIHGTKDVTVPIEISRRFAEAATAKGLDAKLIPMEGADHFPPMDPRDPEWKTTESTILSLLGISHK